MNARSILAVVLGLAACSHESGSGDPDAAPKPPMPDAWQIEVDYTDLDRFVDVVAHPDLAWHLAGTVTSSKGLASLSINGANVDASNGSFATDVTVGAGLTRVPVVATDVAGNARKADRSAIAARFLPEGQTNPKAASLVLTPAIVQGMAAGVVAQAGDVDVAATIRAMPTLSSDSQCTTWPTGATQDKTKISLSLSGATLQLHIQIPNLDVTFDGECQGLISTIPISGEMTATLDVTTSLTALPGAPCVTAFGHSAPDVAISGWSFDVWGTGGPLQDWLVSLFANQKGPAAEQQLHDQVAQQADDLLTQKLADVSVLDKTSSIDLLSKPIAMHLCLGALDKVGNGLVARVIASASGGGTATAPGAPILDGAAVNPAAKELVLDANLVGQLLFSAWRAGGLHKDDLQQVDLGLLEALARDLEPMYPDGGIGHVFIDGELPPVVRASNTAAGEMGDLHVELGDLMLTIKDDAGVELFRFGVHLSLDLDLVAQDGKLVPMVAYTSSEVSLLGEIVDGPDGALEEAVQSQLGGAASSLLGNASLALPDVPGLGTPTDVTPDKGGRFVHVKLQ